MGILRNIFSKSGILGELIIFLWQRKLWWLVPIVIILVLLSALLILGSTGLAPFIYPLF